MLETYKLDANAVGALLLCFQKAMMEDVDIRQLFEKLEFMKVQETDGVVLTVLNPPTLLVDYSDVAEDEETVSSATARKIAEDIELR